MIPRKIYLSIIPGQPGDREGGVYEEWSAAPIQGAENHKYVSVDFIETWARELQKNAREARKDPPSIEFDKYMEGKEMTLSKLIWELNEM